MLAFGAFNGGFTLERDLLAKNAFLTTNYISFVLQLFVQYSFPWWITLFLPVHETIIPFYITDLVLRPLYWLLKESDKQYISWSLSVLHYTWTDRITTLLFIFFTFAIFLPIPIDVFFCEMLVFLIRKRVFILLSLRRYLVLSYVSRG